MPKSNERAPGCAAPIAAVVHADALWDVARPDAALVFVSEALNR